MFYHSTKTVSQKLFKVIGQKNCSKFVAFSFSNGYLFKPQPHKMVKRTQTICRKQLTNFLNMFVHFVGFVFKGSSVN